MTFISLPFQCLVNVLKSLVDWEKSHRESNKKSKSTDSDDGGASARESVEMKNREDMTSNFEKAKAHKSTLEASIAQVINLQQSFLPFSRMS